MAYSKYNATAATLTKNRTVGSVTPNSGLCVTCVDGCVGMCEVGKSALRGCEVIYHQPFGITTTASERSYPMDLNRDQILGGPGARTESRRTATRPSSPTSGWRPAWGTTPG